MGNRTAEILADCFRDAREFERVISALPRQPAPSCRLKRAALSWSKLTQEERRQMREYVEVCDLREEAES